MSTSEGQQRARALEFIASCSDAKKLRQMIENARRRQEADVERAAELRLYSILPSAMPGTLEHDVWQSIHALEGALTDERSRTTRLGRTRPKIKRDGEQRTVADLVNGKPSEGFAMLLERGMPELTFEAVALRHRDRFDDGTLRAAEDRLRSAGIDLSVLKLVRNSRAEA